MGITKKTHPIVELFNDSWKISKSSTNSKFYKKIKLLTKNPDTIYKLLLVISTLWFSLILEESSDEIVQL